MTTQAFTKQLYLFFKQNKRDFPWRKTSDPYHIMVSEYMLQQTQVSRVIEKYPLFLKTFPTIESLASASRKEVLHVWQGLGYNRRALYLHAAAKKIVQEWKGSIPKDPSLLQTLPGIGKNTAGAICAFAFNLPVIFIETNIRSVYIYTFFKKRKNVNDAEIIPLIEKMIDKNNPRKWYSALMDYGTYLKKEQRNPSRKSVHYIKQSSFKGSIREVRGYIVKQSIANPLFVEEIEKEYGETRTKKAIDSLLKEGVIKKKGFRIYITE